MAKISPLNRNTPIIEGVDGARLTISREFTEYLNQIEKLTVSDGTNLNGIHVQSDGSVRIGDGTTNYTKIDTDGEITLGGTAKVTKMIQLPIATGGGTVTVSAITGSPSIDFNADGEIVYAQFHTPKDWDTASDFTIKALVQNEIAETDGDDISFTGTVHGIADGETNADNGQTVAISLDLTGDDEGINRGNLVNGTIDYDNATYPISDGDNVVIKLTVNLGGAGECTGPLHILDWWIEYTASKLGTAT